MKVGFVLLVDPPTHNFMRKLAFELDSLYRTGLLAAYSPAHVSLKQPFHADDLPAVEAYFDTFVASIRPFDIALDAVEIRPAASPNRDTGIVWLTVRESSTLRDLHNQLNAELATRFAHTEADFDGPAYRFHATVAIGGQPSHVYQTIAAEYSRRNLDLICHVSQIVMCVADDDQDPPGPFISYNLQSLE